jgi:hypothetical protein
MEINSTKLKHPIQLFSSNIHSSQEKQKETSKLHNISEIIYKTLFVYSDETRRNFMAFTLIMELKIHFRLLPREKGNLSN